MEPATQATPVIQSHSVKLPSAFSLFGPSWRALKVSLSTFVLLFLAPIALVLIGLGVFLVLAEVNQGTEPTQTMNALYIVGSIVLFLACFYLYMVMQVALLAAQLKGAQGVRLGFKAAIKYGTRYWFRMLALGLAVAVIVVVGLVLLIVPGLFMLKRYYLAPYYMLDHDLGALEAMRRSAADSKRFGMAVWGLLGATLLLAIASALLGIIPILGWLASIALSVAYYCAPAVRYAQIKNALLAQHMPTSPQVPVMQPILPGPPTPTLV